MNDTVQLNKEEERAGEKLPAVQGGAYVRISWTDLVGSPRDFPQRARSFFPRDEVYRISRFVREPDRRLRYAAAGLLVDLAEQAFGDLDGLSIDRDRFGRPCLTGRDNADISVSHSGGIVVCALSTHGRIGIDIEQIRPVDTGEFDRVFPESLSEWLQADCGDYLRTENVDERFFHAWTRLESVIKADGRGLCAPLSDFVFSDREASFGTETRHLSVIPIADGYVCSIAVSVPVAKFEVNRVVDPG